jgi:hypothetical protein
VEEGLGESEREREKEGEKQEEREWERERGGLSRVIWKFDLVCNGGRVVVTSA